MFVKITHEHVLCNNNDLKFIVFMNKRHFCFKVILIVLSCLENVNACMLSWICNGKLDLGYYCIQINIIDVVNLLFLHAFCLLFDTNLGRSAPKPVLY